MCCLWHVLKPLPCTGPPCHARVRCTERVPVLHPPLHSSVHRANKWHPRLPCLRFTFTATSSLKRRDRHHPCAARRNATDSKCPPPTGFQISLLSLLFWHLRLLTMPVPPLSMTESPLTPSHSALAIFSSILSSSRKRPRSHVLHAVAVPCIFIWVQILGLAGSRLSFTSSCCV